MEKGNKSSGDNNFMQETKKKVKDGIWTNFVFL